MRRVLPIVLLGGAVLLFCIGVAAVGANLYLNRSASVDLTKWQAPLNQVDVKKITPADALDPLAGVSDGNSIDDALTAGDWEGAFALVAYSPDYADMERAGVLLVLASRYAAAKQTAKAAWCYQYVATLATLSAQPSDLTRVQTLFQAAAGLHSLQLDTPARAALDQAYLIAEYSYTLQRDTRSRVLGEVAQSYQLFGVSNLATQAKQKSDEASALTSEDAVNSARKPYRVPAPGLPANPELTDKTKARVTAAKELIDSLNTHPPKSAADLPEDLIRALGDKLYEEDGVRHDYYDSQYQSAADASAQVAVLNEKISWLALKLRVARGGFGLSIVPEWEIDAKNIATELNDAFDQLFQISEQQAGAGEKAEDADRGVEDVLRSAIIAGRWGLYRDYDENDLRSHLDEISQRLRDENVSSLRLDSFVRGAQINYLLLPDELYGQGEKALPR